MLGSSLGVVESGKFCEIRRTSFGENASSANEDFFTGKPNVEGLGYAFLFRNYRSETGKWMSSDPLGYPDGWNNLAYVNNWVTYAIDYLGAETLICREVVDGMVKHQWVEIHRNGEITAAAGFYPSEGSLYGPGQINMGGSESHINDQNKDVTAVYRTTAEQERALMQEIANTYVPNPPFYTIYPPQYTCVHWADDIQTIIHNAWGFLNDLDNVTNDELLKWGNDKISKDINDITKMPE
jgi:RHS repeat-associated protein